MAESSTLTVCLPTATKSQPATLASELIVEGIARGREDVRAGRVAPHEAVAAEAAAVIEVARAALARSK